MWYLIQTICVAIQVIGVEFMKRIIEHEHTEQTETENPRVKTAIYLSCVAGACTIIVMVLVSINFITIYFRPIGFYCYYYYIFFNTFF